MRTRSGHGHGKEQPGHNRGEDVTQRLLEFIVGDVEGLEGVGQEEEQPGDHHGAARTLPHLNGGEAKGKGKPKRPSVGQCTF